MGTPPRNYILSSPTSPSVLPYDLLSSKMELDLNSRALGAIWGSCVGDALGGPIQFMHVGEFKPVTGLRYVQPFQQPAG